MVWRAAVVLCLICAFPAFAAPSSPPDLAAARASGPIVIDGRLDETGWTTAAPVDGFVQIEPRRGEAATQDTEVRVLFDEHHLYLGFRCRDSAGGRRVRVPDLRRDFDEEQNDFVGVVLDPFGDGRTAQVFYVNPFGAQHDLRAIDGTQTDLDWNALWHAAANIEENGWTAEIALPWSSIRYPGGAESWHANFVRRIRRDDELTAWVEYPRHYSPYHMTHAGALVGLEPPPPASHLQVTPYALASGERRGTPGAKADERGSEIGGEIKWLPGSATTIDATVNTDFAQVEVDRQVVNLGRFSVLFPEKRQFFLENSTLFESDFGDHKPFFSRRIGLDESGVPVPIDGGLRLVHQDARHAFGGLVMQTREQGAAPQSRFALARYSRNFGERNRLGGLVVHRSDEGGALADGIDNTVAQIDGVYRPTDHYSFQGLLAASRTSGDEEGDGFAGSVWTYYQNERIYVGLLEHVISDGYDPRTGFLSDRNLIVTSPAVRLDWRPDWLPRKVRRLRPNIVSWVYHDYDDREFREGYVRVEPLWVVFQDGSEVWSWVEPNRQRLEEPFAPLPGLEVAPGEYDYTRWGVAASSDRSRKASLEAEWIGGGFFDGELDKWILSGRLAPSPRLALTVDYERNDIRDLGPTASARSSELIAPELRLALNPRLQLAVFYQHNTAAERDGWNARFIWEWRPLSFLHLVYTRDTPTDPHRGFLLDTGVEDERLILKMTWTGQF